MIFFLCRRNEQLYSSTCWTGNSLNVMYAVLHHYFYSAGVAGRSDMCQIFQTLNKTWIPIVWFMLTGGPVGTEGRNRTGRE